MLNSDIRNVKEHTLGCFPSSKLCNLIVKQDGPRQRTVRAGSAGVYHWRGDPYRRKPRRRESQVGVVQATSPQTFYFLTHLAPLFRSATQPGQVVASIRGRFEDFKKLFETIHEYVFLANYCLLALKGFIRIAAAPWK